MNNGQMLMALLALVLLSMTILSINQRSLNASDVVIESKIDLLATSVAKSILEEAQSKAYDEVLNPTQSTQLTSSADFGPDAGEANMSNYDDFDDFHSYPNSFPYTMKYDPNDPKSQITFSITGKVEYMNLQGNSSIAVATGSNPKTWHKRLTVTVTHPSMKSTIQFSVIKSFSNF